MTRNSQGSPVLVVIRKGGNYNALQLEAVRRWASRSWL